MRSASRSSVFDFLPALFRRGEAGCADSLLPSMRFNDIMWLMFRFSFSVHPQSTDENASKNKEHAYSVLHQPFAAKQMGRDERRWSVTAVRLCLGGHGLARLAFEVLVFLAARSSCSMWVLSQHVPRVEVLVLKFSLLVSGASVML